MLLNRLRELPARLSGPARNAVLLGLADATITGTWAAAGLLRRPRPRPAGEPTITLEVIDRAVVARDENVVALTLAAPDRAPLPSWHPGAHLDIHLPSGRVRQYSLCGNTDVATGYRIAVRRIPDGGGGSVEVHDALTVGTRLTTHGPRNAFPLSVPAHGSPARRLRFIAGGIGITPILPMLGLAQRLGTDWSMVYAGRTADSIPFLDELRRFGGRVRIRTDDVDGVPTADELLGECPSGTAVYTCGPAPMLTAIRDRLAGRDDVELHFERFAPPPVTDGEQFGVTVGSTGERIDVAATETLLTALRRHGVAAPYSCQQGFCGTCRVRVLSGKVEHRDFLLTDTERTQGMMLTCVSRAGAGGHLTIDI